MSRPIALIQLVSEQTIQNLLPILALKPAKVIHLVSPKTAGRDAHLQAAAKGGGVTPKYELVNLAAMPGVSETRNAVNRSIEAEKEMGREPVVNFTGGTKLMSIGSFAAAATTQVPSLYVDTQGKKFVDGATSPRMGEILDGDWSFTSLAKLLQVHTLAVANGVSRVTSGQAWRRHLDLAQLLFNDRNLEEAVHGAIHGPSGFFSKGREPRDPAGWLEALDQPISLPEEVAKAAAAGGWVRLDARGRAFLPDASRRELRTLSRGRFPDFARKYFRAIAPLQNSCGFLSGGWWEVIVADAMDCSGLMRDLRWSVQVGSKAGPDLEEDVVALDGVELVYVSCKRGGHRARLLPLLEEIHARARSMGGSFNRRFLAVLKPPAGRTKTNLMSRSDALGIRIITGHNVYAPGVFTA